MDKKMNRDQVKLQIKKNKESSPVFRSFMDHKIAQLGKGFEETHQLDDLKKPRSAQAFCDDGTTPITDDLFAKADYDASQAERIGYSNYSYWGSTLRVFLKNKLAVGLMIFLVVLLLFTFIQPLLPNQKPPTAIFKSPRQSPA